ncbi:LysR family transcriptional regulator, partial [Nonomuraea terrae]
PAGHRLAGRGRVDLRELRGETFADCPADWGSRIVVDRAFRAAAVERTVRYEVGDFAGVVDFVHHGLAVAIVPPAVVDPWADVRLIRIDRPAPRIVMSIAIAVDRELSRSASALFEAIRRRASGR